MAQLKRAPSKIPEFGSIAEEAEFWDTHSTAEFEDEWEPVELDQPWTVRSRYILTLEFDRPTWEQLRDLARRRNVRLAELAQTWVLEGYARAADAPDDDSAAGGEPNE